MPLPKYNLNHYLSEASSLKMEGEINTVYIYNTHTHTHIYIYIYIYIYIIYIYVHSYVYNYNYNVIVPKSVSCMYVCMEATCRNT